MLSRPLIVSLLLVAAAVQAAPDFTQETPAQREARMAWFNQARFGLFVHWGLYAVPAGEWNGKRVGGGREWIMETAKIPVSEYEKFIPQFNPVKFKADDWVRAAKGAGMKYIVITSKHHDGFGLWRSKSNPTWSMTATPYPGDPLKDLSAACAEQGITFCLYHSIMDWTHPDWGTRRAYNDRATGTPDMDRYTAYMKGQLKELLGGDYGKVGILWFDGEWESPWTHERGVDLYNYVRGLQPDIIVNNRVGKNRKGMQGMSAGSNVVGDYGTPEQEIPSTGFGADAHWESCMTMNTTWGFAKDDHDWKSTTKLVRNLIDCASKGGNYLLNVGPMADGQIPQPSLERLEEIGAWMAVNSEAVYGTTASPFRQLPFAGRCTLKGRRLFVHVFEPPTDRVLRLNGLTTPAQVAWRLADASRTPLQLTRAGSDLLVTLPEGLSADPHATVVVVDLEASPVVDTSIRPGADGSVLLPAGSAEVTGHGPATYEGGHQRDCIGVWSSKDNQATWTFRVDKPGRYAVEVTTAARPTSAGNAFQVEVSGQTVLGQVESTGDWGVFVARQVGAINIATAGAQTLTVRPVKIAGEGLMNLRTVRLLPQP